MKKNVTVLFAVLISACLWAQAPQSFSYQAVVRGTNNILVSNKPVGMKVSLLQGSENGNAVYSETHTPNSNDNGLVSIEIGKGNVVNGTFATIDWSKGPFYVKTESDPNGGTNYTLITTSQLLSVPYALFAGNALPSGGTNGQGLTICDGLPTWTTGGICPGKIKTLNCSGAVVYGSLKNGIELSNTSFVVSYDGGNGGPYSLQNISSTGVDGLTASLQANSFANGTGNLTFNLKGIPSSAGNALFALNIGGQTCSVSLTVDDIPTEGKIAENITDIENNSYKTVTIGSQRWMAENLKVSKYNDGTPITNITDNTQWSQLTTGAWSYYNNDETNNSKYGKLYNWNAITPSLNGNKNVCPTGWHIPSDYEWTVLTDFLGGQAIAGGKMKEVGTTNWTSPNSQATNSALFNGLPGGARYEDGIFKNFGLYGYWWSSTEGKTSATGWARALYYANGYAYDGNSNKYDGLSIRCIKD